MPAETLTMSVIIPAYNAEHFLPLCLDALGASTWAPLEIIVVDDGSTDSTAAIAAARGAKVINTARARSGPGAARNAAAQVARGEILLFVDADVVVQADTLARVHAHFRGPRGPAAVFGSYDTEPAAPNFLSQYKNLQHHYVHQQAEADAATFWAGCGAIRRDVFLDVGGFDVAKYARPSIEDIDLGYRLRDRGLEIKLDANIQVRHLKRWTFWPLLHTEIFCRAIPWSELLLSGRGIPRDLNLRTADRISAVLVWLILASLSLAPWRAALLVIAAGALVALIALNRGFYGFLLRHRGLWFVVRTIPMHALYYLYSSLTFAWCWVRHRFEARAPGAAAG